MSGGRKCKHFELCHQNAQVLIKSFGLALCKKHFLEHIEDRVAKTIERYHMLPRLPTSGAKERWVIAMSGGKDSQVLAEILCKALRDRVDFFGVYVDVGVRGNSYTDASRKIVEDTCARLNIPCTVIDTRRDGLTMDDVHVTSRCRHGGNRTECSACGIVKRYHINRAAVELHADKVATGHHMTDEATTLLSNFLSINIDQLGRGLPWERREVAGGAALLPRVKPFLEVSEEETALYAHLGQVPHVAVQCPYAVDATSTALKKHMLGIERDRPGTMLRLVRGFHKDLFPVIAAGRSKLPAAPAAAAATSPAPAASPEPVPEPGAASVTPAAPTDAAEETLPAVAEEDAVALVACTRCGFPTTCKVCAYCKLREQVNEFRAGHGDLFGGPAAGSKAHTCEICCPPPPDATPAPAAAADVEGDVLKGGVCVTMDLAKKSHRWMKRQRANERHAKLPQATNVGAPAAAAAAAPAAPAAAPAAAAPAAAAPAAPAATEEQAPAKMDTSK